MLEPPGIPTAHLIAHLHDTYGLRAAQLDFLPLGADVNSAVYRAAADDGRAYFLKLRRGPLDELSVRIPAFLAEQGVEHIIPPLRAAGGGLWTALEPFTVTLYPFVAGADGYEVTLSERQWVELGATLQRIHAAPLPADLRRALPRESFSPQWREQVRGYMALVGETYDDPIAAELAAFLRANADTVRELVETAEQLAHGSKKSSADFADYADFVGDMTREWVLCHADIHNGNVLIGQDGTLYVVDWDTALLAPKERDLMFVGAGNLGRNQPEERDWFYRGYGATAVDPAALTYYRCERIVQDIAAFCEQILATTGPTPDRAQALRWLKSQFEPHCEVEIALLGARF
ncbi:phosphotransferase enzyme family protein [Promineifilum sp.]|uniref:phosphotransferase enzyme family protein n=1 Tax=Promineifilum sp. TaxID=2664178 RepID=UPI0035ADBF92